MRFKAKVIGSVLADVRRFDKRLAVAVSAAMKEAATELRDDLRGQIISAGLGKRLSNTWRLVVYPENGNPSKGASAVIFSNAPHIITAFDHGLTIRAKNKKFLAIPTKFVSQYIGAGKTRKQMTPANFERFTGIKLYFVQRRGRNPLLVARGVRVTKSGNIAGLTVRRSKSGAEKVNLKGRAEVPVFVLIPVVKLKNSLDVLAAFRRHGGKVPGLIDNRLGNYED